MKTIVAAVLFTLTIACTSAPAVTPVPAIAITPEIRIVTATPSSTPPATQTPIPPTATWTPEPTPTITPTPTATPVPLAAIYGVELDRIRVIDGRMLYGNKPIVLVGCHADTIGNTSAVFTRNGNLPEFSEKGVEEGIAIIKGYFPKLARGGCYEMAVEWAGTGSYNYGYFATPFHGTSIQIREYKLLHYSDAVRTITKSGVTNYRLPDWTPTPSPTPRPTPTPTLTPTITPTPEPTPTPTPKPTPTPTRTPLPTIPTWTPTPVVPLSQKWDVRTTLGVEAAHKENRATTLKRLIVVGCYAGLQDTSGGEEWFTFSRDGSFSEDRKFVGVTGFSKWPKGSQCYEMVVRYEKETNYCYFIQLSNVPRPNIPGHCSGWRQNTREFYLVDKDAWRLIPKDEWRRDYRDTYAK